MRALVDWTLYFPFDFFTQIDYITGAKIWYLFVCLSLCVMGASPKLNHMHICTQNNIL